jgi:hypothetical protein
LCSAVALLFLLALLLSHLFRWLCQFFFVAICLQVLPIWGMAGAVREQITARLLTAPSSDLGDCAKFFLVNGRASFKLFYFFSLLLSLVTSIFLFITQTSLQSTNCAYALTLSIRCAPLIVP